jgi:signal transduction histidine kinase/CheY-like chemotaxis protein
MLDRELRYIACSRRWVSDYRLEGQPLIGRCHYDVFPEIPARWREIHRLALSGAPQRCDEDRFERADGSVQWLRWAIEPWRDADGAIGGVIFFTEDITPRKQLEAQRERLEDELRQAQKLDSLGKLAGGIAHDFNNLIGVIVGNVELARQLDPAPALCACLDDIAAAGARAGELVRQILTFSRRHPARRVVTVPGPVVAEVARLLRATVPAGVRLQVEVADDVPPVRIAPNQIHQVLMNLAANAWQAMPGGSGNVGLRVTGVTVPVGTTHPVGLAPGRHALLQVSDDGTGMTPDVQARMFEPFFTTKSVGAGTGLGLPVVHGIVAGHGGVIHVDSAPGRGTTVSIWLPEATPEAAPEPAPTASLPRGAGHLLVLDDEELLVRVEARLLEQLGFTVDQFVRPADAIAAVRAHPGRFDAVLTDQNMPGLGGLEVARAIAAIRPDLPIVLLSGDRIYSDEQLAAANVRACLDKPYSADALGEVVARVLRR